MVPITLIGSLSSRLYLRDKIPMALPLVSNTTIQDCEKREMKAKVLLKLLVKDCIIPHIRECKTTNDIYMILKEMYEIGTPVELCTS